MYLQYLESIFIGIDEINILDSFVYDVCVTRVSVNFSCSPQRGDKM